MELTEEQLKGLKQVHQIQGRTGNWDYDPYMHGLYNGLEMALAIVEDRDTKFKDAPARWLKDNPTITAPRDRLDEI